MGSGCTRDLGNPREFTLVLALTGSSSKIVYQPLPADDPKQRLPALSRMKVPAVQEIRRVCWRTHRELGTT
jgi:hypothetical protein